METETLPARLFRLQELEAAIEQLESRLRDVRRREQMNPHLERTEADLDRARAQTKESTARQRRLEAELTDLEAKTKRGHGRLYGGAVVDPRELASLEHELGHLQGKRGELEDQLLASMEEADVLSRRIEELSREANESRERWEGDRPSLEAEEEGVTDELAGLREEREKLTRDLDSGSLSLYRRIIKSQGHAVSRISDGICERCRVVIPPKDVQHARAGALVHCTNCARILYGG